MANAYFRRVNLELILLCLFGIAAAFQLALFFFFYARLSFRKEKHLQEASEPVSVVICAKNEAENLLNNLPSVLEQNYPDFQVVVVNDNSWDDTENVLKAFSLRYPRLKVVSLSNENEFTRGKKFALTMGIKASENELLVMTDADCKPSSENWLSGVVGSYAPNQQVALGYGGYKRGKGLLNAAIRFDAFWIAIQYLSFALAGIPFMGVGRNLSYRKDLFFRHKGFASHQFVSSGDDDLFINEAATSNNCSIIDGKYKTISAPKETWLDWFKQKKRHLTTAARYKLGHKILLGTISWSILLYYVLLVLLLCIQAPLIWVGGIFLVRMLFQLLIFQQAGKNLEEQDLWYLAPLLEIVLVLFYFVVSLSNLLRKQSSWEK